MKPLKSSWLARRVWFGLFGLIWLTLFVQAVLDSFASDGPTPWLLLFMPFALIGLGFLGWALLPLVARVRLASPDVQVSNDAPHIGEGITFTYRQVVKGDVPVDSLRVHLVFTETARRGDGKNSQTRTHEVVVGRHEEPGRAYRAGEVIERTVSFRIPPDGMHTFITSHNKLQWEIRVRLAVPGWPDFNDAYEIKVQPERAG